MVTALPLSNNPSDPNTRILRRWTVAGSSSGRDDEDEKEEEAAFDAAAADDGHTCCPSVRKMRHCTSDDKCESDDDASDDPEGIDGCRTAPFSLAGSTGAAAELVDEEEEEKETDLGGKSGRTEAKDRLDLLCDTDCFAAGDASPRPSTVLPRTRSHDRSNGTARPAERITPPRVVSIPLRAPDHRRRTAHEVERDAACRSIMAGGMCVCALCSFLDPKAHSLVQGLWLR